MISAVHSVHTVRHHPEGCELIIRQMEQTQAQDGERGDDNMKKMAQPLQTLFYVLFTYMSVKLKKKNTNEGNYCDPQRNKLWEMV